MQIQRDTDYNSIIAELNHYQESEEDEAALCAFHDKLCAYTLSSNDTEKRAEIESIKFRILPLLEGKDRDLSLKIHQSLGKLLQSKKELKMRQNSFQELSTIKKEIQNSDNARDKFPHTLALVKNIAREIDYNFIKKKRTEFLETGDNFIKRTKNHFLEDEEAPAALCAFHDRLNAYVLTLQKSENRTEIEKLKSAILLRLDEKDENLSLKIEESLKKIIQSRKEPDRIPSSIEELTKIKKEIQRFENVRNKFPHAEALINNITNEFDSDIIRNLDAGNLNANGELPQDCGMSAGSLISFNEKLRTFGSASSAGFTRTALSSDCIHLFINSINMEEISEKKPELPFGVCIHEREVHHWILFIVDPVEETVSMYDALGKTNVQERYKSRVIRQAQQRITEPKQSVIAQNNQKKHEIDFTRYKWENESYRVQYDDHSCGVWAILTAYKVLESPDFRWKSKGFTTQALEKISAAFRQLLHERVFKAACDDFINVVENENRYLKTDSSLPKEEIQNMFADFCREWNI